MPKKKFSVAQKQRIVKKAKKSRERKIARGIGKFGRYR
jgi:hypothetical protein